MTFKGKSVRLLLIDHDPIFRLGLRTFLTQFSDLEVLAAVSSVAEAMQSLGKITPEESAVHSIDLVILSVGPADPSGQEISAIAPIQELIREDPHLPLLLIDSLLTYEKLNEARQAGVKGYFPKGTDPSILVNAIRQIAAGESDWVAPEIPIPEKSLSSYTSVNAREQIRPWSLWSQNFQGSANQQMDAQILQLNRQLQNPTLSEFDRFFLLGRRRELRVARWMVDRMLEAIGSSQTRQIIKNPQESSFQDVLLFRNRETTDLNIPDEGNLQRSPQLSNVDLKSIQSDLFDRILVKLQSHLTNLTDISLEIDILEIDKKQQLLYLVLRQFEEILVKLKYSQVELPGLMEKRDRLLLDLWQATLSDFFGKYSSLRFDDREIQMIPMLMEDVQLVKSSILDKIPQAIDLFSYLLFQTSFTIENTVYVADSSEAMQQAEALLENLMIQVANGVIFPLLNQLSDVEEIKQEFYDKRWMTTRELERFRNNLSWRYRWEKYWEEPKAIFESQYLLLVLDERGIRKMPSYAPRGQELSQLNGLQQTVTLFLETRDAIAPRVQSILVFIGSGGRYVLIQLGRGLGLIAQGIIQGIGNSFQDLTNGKNREP